MSPPDDLPLGKRVRRLVAGPPRDLADSSLFRHISLIALLAWVGLGADGLSSCAYGPEEAFRILVRDGDHTYLAVALALMTALTVGVIALAYGLIIEEFPQAGGGYVVATHLLGPRAGVVSGCALLVDYVLTITVSIAAAGDALFSFLPAAWGEWRITVEVALILLLTALNIRGVRESVTVLAPVFILFAVTHLIVILAGLTLHAPQLAATIGDVGDGFQRGHSALGLGGMVLLFIHAYSLGGGTYTGIEAVSNGLPIMREPRVKTAKRTMLYMALSLAFVAGGLILCYLLWDVRPAEGKTMNAVLLERLVTGMPGGEPFVAVTLFSEGALLVVAALAGFIAGPRVLASMAVDSWAPRRFAALSDRLTTQNGIVLFGAASLAALLYTGGDTHQIVVMYSINVFLTFTLSLFGMFALYLRVRGHRPRWRRRLALFAFGFLLCATILGITVFEKFHEGGWLTLTVTGTLIAGCFLIRRHYRLVTAKVARLYEELKGIPTPPEAAPAAFDPAKPTAVVLVASYSGLGIHTFLNIWRAFPGFFQNVVFVSVGVIDSGDFKGARALQTLTERTEDTLRQYVRLAERLGIPAQSRMAIGTEVLAEAERLCLEVAQTIPRCTFFAGKVIFRRQAWYQRILHNDTADALQSRLHWRGRPMVIMPARVE
ncbi:MAG: APC family permease [Candidatus Sumerlaeia bacterium]|nr:APC family permease [Candidatus Sumerlaeia bacterium]